MDLGEYINFKEALVICGSGLTTSLVWAFIIDPFLDRRASKGGFIDSRSLEEKFMNHLNYYQEISCNSRAQIPPESTFGKIVQYLDYYKLDN